MKKRCACSEKYGPCANHEELGECWPDGEPTICERMGMNEPSKIPEYWTPLLKLALEDPAIYAAVRCVEGGQKSEDVLVQLVLCLAKQAKAARDEYIAHLQYCSSPSLMHVLYGKKG